MPAIFLEQIELLRERSKQEKSYDLYLDEVSTECLNLQTAWSPSARAKLDSKDRSTYIDMLATLSITPSSSAPKSLDPNFNIFLEMDVDARFEMLRLIKIHRQKEIKAMPSDVLKFISSEDQLSGIVKLAEFMGYEPIKKVKNSDEFIDFYVPKNQSFFSKIRLVDLKSFRKRGYVLVHYFISASPDLPFYLGSFVPYGNSYCESNTNTEGVFFSFYSQSIFLNDFVSLA